MPATFQPADVSLTTIIATTVLDGALGAWLGTMAFFSFVGAPRAFAVFDDAGAYVNDVFPRYYAIGVALGGASLVAGVAVGVLGSFDAPVFALLGLTALAVVLAGYSRWVLIPRMDAAGEDAFETYHRLSVALNGGMMLLVAAALVASHAA